MTHPLRLATGSHQAGSGKGCAMNVISWESGDTTITDLPACADPVLARIVQRVNDTICAHRTGDLLCPACSVLVLALAHRTVGTGGPADLDRRRVWVRVAADQARQVLHLATNRAAAEAAIVAAEAWADSPTAAASASSYASSYAASSYAASSYAASSAAAADAADAAYAASAASDAASSYAASDAAADAAAASSSYASSAAAATASSYAASSYAAASYASSAARLRLAHRAIDTFNALTGHTEQQPDPDRTTAAYTAMTTPDKHA